MSSKSNNTLTLTKTLALFCVALLVSGCSRPLPAGTELTELGQSTSPWHLQPVMCGEALGDPIDASGWTGECFIGSVPRSLPVTPAAVEGFVTDWADDVTESQCTQSGQSSPVVTCFFFSEAAKSGEWNKVFVSVFPLADSIEDGTGLTVWVDAVAESPEVILERVNSLED